MVQLVHQKRLRQAACTERKPHDNSHGHGLVPANAARIDFILFHEILHHCHGGRNDIFLIAVEGHMLLQHSATQMFCCLIKTIAYDGGQ